MIVYIYNIGVDLYNGFNGLRHRINWTYFTVLDGLAHPLYSFFETLPNVNYISNDSINDLGLEILKTTKEYPGISAPKITLQIQKYDSSITL